jgi:hypothetical protein
MEQCINVDAARTSALRLINLVKLWVLKIMFNEPKPKPQLEAVDNDDAVSVDTMNNYIYESFGDSKPKIAQLIAQILPHAKPENFAITIHEGW